MRTDVSTLNPECFHPRTRRASARRRRSRLWRRQAGAAGATGDLFTNLVFVKKEREDAFLPELHGTILEDIGDVNEMAGLSEYALRDYSMHVRIPIDKRAPSLHGPDTPRKRPPSP